MAGYEVMHGDIRLTLNDAEAISGAKRVEREVKRSIQRLDRERAVIHIEGNLKDYKRSLKEAEALTKAHEKKLSDLTKEREGMVGSAKGAITRKINAEQKLLDTLRAQVDAGHDQIKVAQDHLDTLKRTNKEISNSTAASKERQKAEDDLLKLYQRQQDEIQKRGKMESQAHAMNARHDREREVAQQRLADAIQKQGRMESQAHSMNLRFEQDRVRTSQKLVDLAERSHQIEADRPRQIAKLQQEYDKAFQKLQRIEKQRNKTFGGKFREAASPAIKQRVDMDQAHAVEEMLALRAKLEALGAKPVEIKAKAEGENVLSKLSGLGDIGTRIGPFSGTLAQFTKAALFLGPILTGLVGTVGALAGAIGTGLTGALGIAGAGALGFGATFGGVFLALKPIATQFKEINKAANAYHQQVHKTGAESDKAKNKLKEFNHVTADLSPHARQAFLDLGNLNSRWKELTHASRTSGMEGMAEGVSTLSATMPMLARNTNIATKALSKGFGDWMKGLRGAEGQGIINKIMGNTNAAIPDLMQSLGHLGATLGRLTASFSRTFKPLLHDFNVWTASLDDATKNTDKLDGGVDRLTDSFRDVLGVTTAFGRVIKEMAVAAMGPGGSLMDDMAGGLNDLARGIHDNPEPLKKFFGDSIDTTKALYNTLLPLTKLFLEFSTILRPATAAVLSLVGPLAELVHTFTAFGPIRLLFQAWATTWLFKRGTAAIVGVLAGTVNALAAAMLRLGSASKGAALSKFASSLGGAKNAVAAEAGAVTAARAGAATGTAGKVPVVMGGRTVAGAASTVAGRAAPVAAAEAAQVGRLAKMGSLAASGLSGLSYALLGVSAPVAALGIAAVAGAVGIKRLADGIHDQHERNKITKAATGVDPTKPLPHPGGGIPVVGGAISAAQNFLFSNQSADTGRLEKLTKDYQWLNTLQERSGVIQRQLTTTFSTYANAQLTVESAEKQYGAAVKSSGKNSLEARMALQQLTDAKHAEADASREWGREVKAAGADAARAVAVAQNAWEQNKGKPGANKMKDELIKARDAVAAFHVNVDRARAGMEIFTGKGSEQIGRFARQWDDIKNVKKLLIQVDDQAAAQKLATLVTKVKDLGGHAGDVRSILITAKTPEEAIRRLKTLLDNVEKQRTAHIQAKKEQAEKAINGILRGLGLIHDAKPTAHPNVATAKPKADIDSLLGDLGKIDGADATAHVTVAMKLAGLPKLTDAPPGPAGDGHGYTPGSVMAAAKGMVRKSAENQKGSLAQRLLGSSLGSMDAPGGGGGLNAFNSIGKRFGLTIGSGLRPGSITKSGNLSYHAMGRARDFPGSPSNMMAFAKYMVSAFGTRLKELIYTPMGFGIKNGQRISSFGAAVDADHYDHVHVAMAQGGRVQSGRYTAPQVLFAEEPGHPEFFISTNPRDKARSQALIAQAADEIGMPQATKFASGGTRGGVGYTVNTHKPTLSQQAITKQAVAVAHAVGATPKALKALLEAIFHESGAQNLDHGDKSSTGPLQLLKSTAKGLGISARNPRDVFEAFLTKGFYGHGGAMKLAKNPKLTAAMIAHLVQGNATGVGVYAGRGGEAASAMRWYDQQGHGVGGATAKDIEKAVTGASSNVANRIAGREAVLTRATRSSNTMNVYDAIMGKGGDQSIPMEVRSKRRRQAASLLNDPNLGSAPGEAANRLTAQVPTAGLMETLLDEDRMKGRRLSKIDKALRPGGRLKPSTRTRLLDERATLVGDRSANRTRRTELRKQANEAKFEAEHGGGKATVDYNNALAESTTGLDDDVKAAQAEQAYYAARYQFMLKNKDAAGATEALTAYNAATGKIKSTQEQIATDKKQADQDGLSARQALAELTPQMDDDLAASNDIVGYWESQLAIAQASNDMPGIATAAGNIKSAKETSKGIQQSMDQLPMDLATAAASLTTNLMDDVTAAQSVVDYWTGLYASSTGADKVTAGNNLAGAKGTLKDATRNAELLPMERDRALAALTDDLSDDEKATKGLRDYWQGQLDAATSAGDVQGQIEAAGNLKSLNDDLKNLHGSVEQQMILLADARRDLFKSFGTNSVQTIAANTALPVSPAYNDNQTHVTVNNTFTQPPEDPHTWSKGVAWELQAAV